MWLLHFFPDSLLAFVVNTTLGLGIIGFIASFFFGYVIRFVPALAPYRMVVQLVSIILLVAGVYLKGGYDTEMDWRTKVEEAEAKVKIAEEKSKEANKKVVTVYKDKIKVVRDTQIVIQEKIVEKEKIIDAECKVAPEAVDILNNAAQGVKK